MIGVPFDRYDEVRIGLIGLGNRGMGMLSGWTAVPARSSPRCATSCPTTPNALPRP